MKTKKSHKLSKILNQKQTQFQIRAEKGGANHKKWLTQAPKRKHKTALHPPKSLFKSEAEENFSLYVRLLIFPLSETVPVSRLSSSI